MTKNYKIINKILIIIGAIIVIFIPDCTNWGIKVYAYIFLAWLLVGTAIDSVAIVMFIKNTKSQSQINENSMKMKGIIKKEIAMQVVPSIILLGIIIWFKDAQGIYEKVGLLFSLAFGTLFIISMGVSVVASIAQVRFENQYSVAVTKRLVH